ncbi:GNAT family N-acetyltransferase [Paenibacillus sp. 481]|uniref:GNAT family N-acetyltransferase n=1 Tax=Paenibacillus sp. 481 TaxID=2835869 RepID=UPI001E5C1429|nr:GNAT family N-acetyltransferase [Paenibacillus sp. 481]UHA75972.1 GNAT family N-acetyltransferase [Paenibacillus sp. 481]
MSEQDAATICTWKYEPPYDLYNFSPWEDMQAEGEEFGDPMLRQQQYVSVRDEAGQLVGFAQFFPMLGVTRLGLGMRPDLKNKGNGAEFVRTIVEEAIRRTPTNEIDLEVLTWNERATHVYEKVGFGITDTYERPTPCGTGTFHCMVFQK